MGIIAPQRYVTSIDVVDLDDLKVLNGNLLGAHMSRHAFTLEYLARIRTSTVGTLMTMEFRTMSHRSSVLTMSLDRALESFTL